MWEFDWSGDLYLEKTTQFCRQLFHEWREVNAAHEVTIILFARILYNEGVTQESLEDPGMYLPTDNNGLD